jgi:hypothetical protein
MPGPDFDNDILYTGLSDFAPALYDESEGELKNISNAPGYNVSDPISASANGVDGYRVGILYDHYGDGRDWWVWDNTTGKWQNIENATTPTIGASEPTVVQSVDNTSTEEGFVIEDRAWTCAVNVSSGNEFRDYVPNETEAENGNTYGCLHGPKGVNNPEDHPAEFESQFELNKAKFDTTVIWANNGSEVTNPNGEVIIGKHAVTINVSVTNTGTGNGTSPLAVLVGNESTNWKTFNDDPDIRDGITELDLNRGESDWFNTTLEPNKQVLNIYNNPSNGDDGWFKIGAGTKDDAIDQGSRPDYNAIWTTSTANFTIHNIESVTPSPPDSIEEGTGTVEVVADIKNQGTSQETGVVRFLVGSDELVDYKRLDIDAGNIKQDVRFEWDLGNSAATKNDSARLKTDEETKGIDVKVTDAASDNSDFQIVDDENDIWNNSVVKEGNRLEVTANVTNRGSEEATKTIVLRNKTTNDVLSWNETTLSAGEHSNVTFEWITGSENVGEYELEVDTTDEVEDFPVKIEAITTSTEYRIEGVVANSTVTAGEAVEVAVNVTNYGDKGSQNVWLEDFTGEPVDIKTSLNLASGESAEFNFTWQTDGTDVGDDDITVNTSNDMNTTGTEVLDPDPGDSDFQVDINYTNSAVQEGQNMTVNVTVNNDGDDGDTQTVVLENFEGNVVDVFELSLGEDGRTRLNLSWRTIVGDADTGYVNVSTEDDEASEEVTITPKPNETRKPADVAFVLDETGSMGTNEYPYNHGDEFESIENPSGTTEVPDGEVWKTCDSLHWFWNSCQGNERYWVPGQEVNLNPWGALKKYDDFNSVRNDPYGERVNATYTALGALNETLGDRAGLVEFNNDASIYQDMTGDLTKVNNSLQIFPKGAAGTNLAAGLRKGEQAVKNESSPNDKYIIFLTDGERTVGPDPSTVSIDSNITVYTVGFGDADNQTLKDISDKGSGDGKFYYSNDAGNLTNIFEAIIGEATEPDTPEFTIKNVLTSNIQVDEGETVGISARINNTGAGPGKRVTALTDFDDLYVDSWSKNLSVGEDAIANYEWDTTGAVNWSQVSGDSVTRDVTIQTPSDNATVSVTINKTEPEIVVGSLDTNATESDDESIAEGETMEVSVTLDNIGDITTETGVFLYNESSGELLAGKGGIDVDKGDSESVTFYWNTEIGESDITDVKAITDYEDLSDASDGFTETVNITDVGTGSSSAFDINITSTNASTASGDSIQEGQELNVSVNVTNVGGEKDSTSLMLWDFNNNTIVDMVQVPELDPGESNESVELIWNTSVGDGDTTDLITVETWNRQHNDTEKVEITQLGTPDANYVIKSVTTKDANLSSDPLLEGSTMEVQVEIENTGDTPSQPQPIVLKDGNDNIGNITEAVIPSGDTQTVTILWKSVPLINQIKVENASAMTKSHTVYIESSATSSDLDISIDSWTPQPTTRDTAEVAGETDIDVSVKLTKNTNLGEEDNYFVALYAEINGQEKLVAVKDESLGGPEPDQKITTMTWETKPRQGSDTDNWEIWAEVKSTETNKKDVYLDVPEGLNPGGPAFGGGDSGVEIDVGDIEVG